MRYQETDKMGVAYHSNYFVWFEVGRTEFFRQIGLAYREFEKNNLFFPVIKVFCQYRQPAHYDDLVKITTRIDTLQEVRLTFKYLLHREETLLAEGETEHVFVNERGKPLVLRKHSPFFWKRMLEALENHK